MLRLALASVLLLSTGAASQTATQVGNARAELNQGVASAATANSSDLPEAPSAIGGSPAHTDGEPGLNTTRREPAKLETNADGSRRIFDRQFILLNTFSTVALVADLETTVYDLGGQSKSAELNPLFGQHPTRARLYGIAVPLNALSFYVSYRYKKSAPGRNLWKLGPGLLIAVHTAATVNNLFAAH